ncbi:MAG: FtsW/RodA/SpoVE family cell cycle protein [Pseudomonadota bacterium]
MRIVANAPQLAQLLSGLLRAPRLLATLAFVLGVALIAGLWSGAQMRLFASLPPTIQLSSVAIPSADAPIVLGWRELGQRPGPQSAARAHLQVRRTDEGAWMAANVAADRKALLLYEDGSTRYLRRWPLRAGDVLEIDGAVFTVGAAEAAQTLTLNVSDGRRIMLDPWGARFDGSNRVLSDVDCGIDQNPLKHLRRVLSTWGSTERRVATFGGGVDCSDRIATGGSRTTASTSIIARDGGYELAPIADAGAGARFKRATGESWRGFAQIETPIAAAGGGETLPSRIVLGRTVYAVATDEKAGLTLRPTENAHRFFETTLQCPPEAVADRLDACFLRQAQKTADTAAIGVLMRAAAPSWSPLNRGSTILSIGVALAVALTTLRFLGRSAKAGANPLRLHAAPPGPTAILIGAAVGGLALFFLHRETASPALLGGLVIGQWSVASLALAWQPERSARLYAYWLAVSVILALGALTLAQLSHGAADGRWLRFDARHQISLMICFAAVTLIASIDLDGFRAIIRRAVHDRSTSALAFRLAPLIGLAALFLAWLALGREEGLGDFQPIEAGKFAAVLFLAVIATRLYHARLFAQALTQRCLLFATIFGAAVFYVALFVLIPGLRGDYSPILIIAGVSSVLLGVASLMLRVHRLSQIRVKRGRRPPGEPRYLKKRWRRPWLETIAVFGAGAAIGLGVLTVSFALTRVSADLATDQAAQFTTVEERLAVFLEPEAHPDLGAQVIRSIGLIADTPCRGVAACAASWGPNPEAIAALPAVQDDFIAAFFVNRFGSVAAGLLAAAQLLVLWLTVDAGLRKYRWSGGDYIDDAARQTLCFVALGGALMLAAHWGVAWANAFGAIPVMGQPMTWVSAGNSHILFMAAPFLLLTLVLLRWPTHRRAPSMEHAPPPYDLAATLIGWAEGTWPGSKASQVLTRVLVTSREGLRRLRGVGSRTESDYRSGGPLDWRRTEPPRRR